MSDPKCICDKESLVVGIGNPLLDISANVDESVLQKYNLKHDDAIMAEEKHMPLYRELMEKYNAEFIAGGSVQNTLRVAQWILKKPKICTYFGCVGNDDYAKILKEKAIADGVNVLYQVTNEAPTGTCAVLVTNAHRSLCANLAAAQRFTPDHLDKEECQKCIEAAKFFYFSGFFIAVSPPSLLKLAKKALERGDLVIMNLSAPFVSQFYKEPLEELLPYVDVVFGNVMVGNMLCLYDGMVGVGTWYSLFRTSTIEEVEAFAKYFNIEEKNVEKIATKISAMPKLNEKKQRVVIITQSGDPVILAEGQKITLVPVAKLSREQMIDTNGAGDAFTGGCLAQMVLGESYLTAVKCGIYAARHIIQHSGCNFSGDSDFKD